MRTNNDFQNTPMSNSTGRPRKLVLARETLRSLTPDELRLAVGGKNTSNTSGSVSC